MNHRRTLLAALGASALASTLMRQHNAGALIVLLAPLFQQQRSQIAELAAKHRLPSMTPDRQYPAAGCLMSYGTDIADSIRRSATYVDKIFKGARALGLTIPQALLISADKVIE